MLKFIFALLFTTLFLTSSVEAKQRFFSITVKAKEDGTLKEALYSSTKIPKKVINQKNFMRKVRRYNPKLRKKKYVKKGEKIYLEMPLKKALLYAKIGRPPEKKPKNPETRFRYSVSYSLSRKKIVDTSDSVTIDSSQNALYTIGASFNHKFNERYSFFTTGYFSKMNTAQSPTTTESTEIDVPIEMAMKIYGQRSFENFPFIVYGGLDVERFTTFKQTSDLQLARLQHSFAFLTIGLAKPFRIFNKTLLAKLSFAQSVWNKLDLQSESNQTFETFSGNKVAGLLIVPILKRIGIHFYYDMHILKAETTLDMQRFGTGVHYRF